MVTPVQTIPYVLGQYRDMPEAEQPALRFRYVSRNDRLRIEQAFNAADKLEGEPYFDAVRAGVLIALAGWERYQTPEGTTRPFDPAAVDDVLSDADYAELRRVLIAHIRLCEAVKKNLLLSRRSAPADSASGAAAVATA